MTSRYITPKYLGTMLRALRAVLVVLWGGILLPWGVSAQRPIVLVHGLGSSPSTWDTTVTRIRNYFGANVDTIRPALPWYSAYENQANTLINAIAAKGANTIAIGHSNGGVVSRLSSADGRSYDGIITIGTPHRGAQLASSTINGDVFREGAYVAYSVAEPFIVYGGYYQNTYGFDVGYYLGEAVYGIGAGLSKVANSRLGYALDYGTVLGEMQPGSNFLTNTLNSDQNLAHESAVLPRRIGLRSSIYWPGLGVPFQAFGFTNWPKYTALVYGAGAVFYAIGDYYEYYNNPDTDPNYYDEQANSYLWYDAADAVFGLDPSWCVLIGSYDFQNGYCGPSDAVVPLASQAYPGGTSILTVAGGPSHTHETANATIDNTVINQLQFTFGVAVPPPPTVALSGPSTVSGCTAATWTAATSNGVAPFSYKWSVEGGSYTTTSNQFSYTNSGTTSSIIMSVQAVDSRGQSSSVASLKSTVRLPCAY